jgi:hypothetical protein
MTADHLPARNESSPEFAEETTPRFFLNPAFDANPEDGDWWLDLGRIDIPTTRPCNTFTTPPRP